MVHDLGRTLAVQPYARRTHAISRRRREIPTFRLDLLGGGLCTYNRSMDDYLVQWRANPGPEIGLGLCSVTVPRYLCSICGNTTLEVHGRSAHLSVILSV